MRQYLDAVEEVLNKGTRKESRTGVDTLSTFCVPYRHDLREGFPLLTTKKISWKNIVAENLWFLSGDPHIGILRKHGCKFWDAWADENGFVPSAYGNFWRRFPVHGPGSFEAGLHATAEFNDQIAWVLAELRRNPMSRRLVVTAWAPGNAQTSKLPPCHVTFVFNVQLMPIYQPCPSCDGRVGTKRIPVGPHGDSGVEYCVPCEAKGQVKTGEMEQRLCLHLTQRSCDMALGVPYNLAGYAFLLELFSHLSGIPAGIFSHMLVDAHVYTCKPDGSMAEYDHVPGLQEQLSRQPGPLPRLKIDPAITELEDISALLEEDTETVLKHFALEGYNAAPSIKFKVAV